MVWIRIRIGPALSRRLDPYQDSSKYLDPDQDSSKYLDPGQVQQNTLDPDSMKSENCNVTLLYTIVRSDVIYVCVRWRGREARGTWSLRYLDPDQDS